MNTKTTELTRRFIPAVIALGLLATAPVRGAELAVYDFTGVANKSTGPASFKAENVNAQDAHFSSAMTIESGSVIFNNNALALFNKISVTGWADGTFGQESYVAFTVSAAPDHVLNLSALKFTVGGSNKNKTNDRYAIAQVRAEVNGAAEFANSLTMTATDGGTVLHNGTVAQVMLTRSSDGTHNFSWNTYTIDLSSLAEYQSITSVTFRIFGNGSAGSANDTWWRLNPITLNGTVTASVVPEPATTALLIAGLLFGAMLLLRRQSK